MWSMKRIFIGLANLQKLPRTLALCVIVLSLPSLAIGFQADDFVIAQRVRSHPFDAFGFIPGGLSANESGERSLLNWSASHALRLRLLRPLSSLSHALDFALWPEAPWLMHLENVLLYAALVGTVALIYTQLLGAGQRAGLAAVFYAFSPAHGTSTGWISSRNTILSALLGLLSVLLFVRAKSRRGWASVAALCVHALALSAGEAALAVLAPLLAYTLILDVGSWRSRAVRVLPHVMLCGGYLLAYAKLGYGAAHSGMYLNALQQPWAVVENFLVAVPLYIHSSLVLPLAGLAGLLPSGVWLLVMLTCITLAALLPSLLPVLRTNAHAQFFALSGLASILPLSAVTPQDRLGFFVELGGYGLLALCLPLPGRVPRALFHLHTSGALLAFVPMCFVCCSPLVGGGPSMLNAALSDVAQRDVVVLNVAVESAIASVSAMRQQTKATQPRSLRALYVGGAAYDVLRVDDRTLDMHVARAWFSNDIESIARDPRQEPFAVGDVESTDLFSARVLEVDARGAPRRVRFQFSRPLDDAGFLWLRSAGAHVLPWTPPRIAEVQHLGAVGSLL